MIIGVMGGVGSGKSEVLKYLESKYAAKIIEADKVTKDLMKKGSKMYEEIKKEFPEVFVDEVIDNEKMAEIVFNNPHKLEKLNEITHPATINEIIKRIRESLNKYIVIESALFMGSEIEDLIDDMWFIYCDKNERIRRLVDTRGYSKDKAFAIISNQPADEDYNAVCDEFIDNTKSFDDTIEQIDFALSTIECD